MNTRRTALVDRRKTRRSEFPVGTRSGTQRGISARLERKTRRGEFRAGSPCRRKHPRDGRGNIVVAVANDDAVSQVQDARTARAALRAVDRAVERRDEVDVRLARVLGDLRSPSARGPHEQLARARRPHHAHRGAIRTERELVRVRKGADVAKEQSNVSDLRPSRWCATSIRRVGHGPVLRLVFGVDCNRQTATPHKPHARDRFLAGRDERAGADEHQRLELAHDVLAPGRGIAIADLHFRRFPRRDW